MPDPQTSTAPAKTQKKTWLIVVVACAAALGGTGIVALLRSSSPAQSAVESAPGVESTLVLDTFVVNLKGDERAYLRAGITLALTHPLPKNKAGGEASIALVRDTVLDVLTTERAEGLLQPEGKRRLKTEVLDALTQRAPELGVKDVYFTEFLVQM